jgi:hypothetical protein
MRKFVLPSLTIGLAVLTAGCGPSLRPLYYDYEPSRSTAPDSSFAKVEDALRETGWQIASADVPNTVATRERTLQQWGLYTVDVTLEAVPMSNGRYVRLLIHPYRDYIIGGESPIAFLPSGLKSDIIPSLNDAFEKRGIEPLGTPSTRAGD